MVRRIATALAAAAIGATALIAAAPASAHPHPSTSPTPTPSPSASPSKGPYPVITEIAVNPNPVVLKHRQSQNVYITVKGQDLKDIRVSIEPKGNGWGHGGGWYGKHDSSYKPTPFSRTETRKIDWNDPVGTWTVNVLALGFDNKEYKRSTTFTVKHWSPPKGPKATRITGFDATPEPVKKGRKLTLQGKLQVAQCYGDWYYDEWDSYVAIDGGADYCRDDYTKWHDWYRLGWQEIDIFFLPKGSHKWRYVTSVDTNPDGTFYTKVRALKSGTWGAQFDGNHRLSGSEAYDYVKVKK